MTGALLMAKTVGGHAETVGEGPRHRVDGDAEASAGGADLRVRRPRRPPRPRFDEAVAKKVYYGPVYFRRESEPYMTLLLAATRLDAGVSVAEISLKLLHVVTQTTVGGHGQVYVIDAKDRLIAHTVISLVLRNADMTQLTQVRAARSAGVGRGGEPVQEAKDSLGRDVLTAYAPVLPLGWLVFVE
jgi:hypothetical protein